METKIIKIGKCIGLTLPKGVCETIGIKAGDKYNLKFYKDIIKLEKEKYYSDA